MHEHLHTHMHPHMHTHVWLCVLVGFCLAVIMTMIKNNLGRGELHFKIQSWREVRVGTQSSNLMVGTEAKAIEQRFSTFLGLHSFNTVPHVVVGPNYKTILLLFHYCIFATVMNYNIISDMKDSWYVTDMWKGHLTPLPHRVTIHRLRTTSLKWKLCFS